MRVKVIGSGAAGNKAALTAMENGVVDKESVLLLNTTEKDVDPVYKDIFIQISTGFKGCGKERNLAKKMLADFLQSDKGSYIESWIADGKPDMVVLVASTSGGSGSGITTLLAKYIREVLGLAVHIFAITGFENDPRELENTIEFFQDMEESFGVEGISNKKFLSGMNTLAAEAAANTEFAKRLAILQGLKIRESVQNIDDTDLLKLATSAGYMEILSIKLPKIKNSKTFEGVLIDAMDETKSLETKSGCHRIGVVLNCSKESLEFIDTNVTTIRERYGIPYESFLHIEHEADMDDFIDVIIGGMKMPIDELKEAYERYQAMDSKVRKEKDSFFSDIMGFRGPQQNNMFNMATERKGVDKNSFFSQLGSKKEDNTSNY